MILVQPLFTGLWILRKVTELYRHATLFIEYKIRLERPIKIEEKKRLRFSTSTIDDMKRIFDFRIGTWVVWLDSIRRGCLLP